MMVRCSVLKFCLHKKGSSIRRTSEFYCLVSGDPDQILSRQGTSKVLQTAGNSRFDSFRTPLKRRYMNGFQRAEHFFKTLITYREGIETP